MTLSADRILDHIERLAACSEQPDGLTRVCLSPEARRAGDLVAGWMRDAGMTVRIDAVGNVVGRYEGEAPGRPALMLGSHLDTVRNAGKYDGMLGVVAAIECVAALNARSRRLACAIEVVGFSDEEGVRFGTTFLGSRAIAGTFRPEALDAVDRDGITLREALQAFGLDPAAIPQAARRRGEVAAYVELHIEQGPVLEAEGLSVGVVTAINGFTRMLATVRGMAGHAGTVPMRLRQDALAAAAQCVLEVERICSAMPDVVGTVGKLEALPGAINVIPGEVRFSLDIRAPSDPARLRAVADVKAGIARIAASRGVAIVVEPLQENGVATCAPWLMAQFERAIEAEGLPVYRLPSGAGHDGQALVELADIAMLFMRCKGGISHNPAEAVTAADVDAASRVLLRFMEQFAPQA